MIPEAFRQIADAERARLAKAHKSLADAAAKLWKR
jgi:hypothetical protein